MATKRAERNFATKGLVEKEEPKGLLAEETAEQTEEAVSEKAEVEIKEEKPVEEVVEEQKSEPAKKNKAVKVVCDQLYLRPEPNKVGTPIGILAKGDKLELVENDAKLPFEWIEVIAVPSGAHGYVMKEFVK